MILPVSICAHLSSSPAAMNSWARLPRPRGLWKAARGTPKPSFDVPHPDDHHNRPRTADSDDSSWSDGDCCDSDSSSNSLSKTFRFLDSPPTSEEDEVIFWDYSRNCSSQPERVSQWTTCSKVMDTSSAVGPGQHRQDTTFDLEDWEDLKELFSKAVNIYEREFCRDICR